MSESTWGTGVDRDTWNALLTAGPQALTHELWTAAIRAVAMATVTRARAEGPVSEDSVEDDAECLIAEWQSSSMPVHAALAGVVGEYDYFRDIDMSWDEKVALAGEACGYASDVVDDLRERLYRLPDAQAAVTETYVEDFYVEWRTCFLKRVLREATGLTTGDRF